MNILNIPSSSYFFHNQNPIKAGLAESVWPQIIQLAFMSKGGLEFINPAHTLTIMPYWLKHKSKNCRIFQPDSLWENAVIFYTCWKQSNWKGLKMHRILVKCVCGGGRLNNFRD